jgi:mannan polymerase II complex MNN10 subunit
LQLQLQLLYKLAASLTMVSTHRGYRFTGSLLPRILVGFLVIGIFFQLSWFSSTSVTRASDVQPVSTTPVNGAKQAWFEDAKKVDQIEDENSSPPQYFVDPTASAEASEPTSASSKPTNATSESTDDMDKFVSYGSSKCLPDFVDEMKAAAIERNHTCTKHAPFPAAESRRVAFATITTGKPAEAYQRAILSQMFSSAVHGSQVHLLCEQLTDGNWNKITYLQNLIMNEMLKPVEERLEWIMWIDRDAIVLDACRPISSFLPPNTTEFADIKLIINDDGYGLNNGVFLFQVGEWSRDFFNTISAFRYYRPKEQLVLAEQSAMENIMREEKFKKGVVRVPWYWFNAFPDEEDSVGKYRNGSEPENLEWFRARKGDFIVHFAGDHGRADRMIRWMNMLDEEGNIYENKEQRRDVTREIAQYWSSWKDKSLTDEQISGDKWKEENVDKKKNDEAEDEDED